MLIYIAALFASVVVVAAGGTRQVESDDAPFQVVSSSGTQVQVDIGSDMARARFLQQATVLTESGAVSATFVRIHRTCKYLCGEGDPKGRECHYEAELRLEQRAGNPIAVFAGNRSIAGVGALTAGPVQPITSDQRWIEAAPFESDSDSYRWERFSDGVYFSSASSGRDFYAPSIPLTGCAYRSIGPFTKVACADAEFLYEGSQAIVFSVQEYGESIVEPRLRFRLDGKEAVAIRFGYPVQPIVALLVREGDRWRLAARGADYALIC